MRILGEEETRQYLLECVNSGEWWVFLPSSSHGYIVEEIEGRYYSGEASADFVAVMVAFSGGLMSIYLARKSRMSPKELFDIIKSDAVIPITLEQVKERDIMFFADWRQAQVLVNGLSLLLGFTCSTNLGGNTRN